MVERFDKCSGGELQLHPATSNRQTDGIVNGVVDVSIGDAVTGVASYNTVENWAREAAFAKVGPLSQWNLVMFTWTRQ